MKWLVVFGMLVAHNTARAECVWGDEVESAQATMTTVTINGKTFSVKGKTARAQFAANMRECGVDEFAVKSFEDWRTMRLITNLTAGVGCCFFPSWFATPVTAILAGSRQQDMLMKLQA